jgi:hypothetical protein
LSPRAPFFCRPKLLFLSPRAPFFCRPEPPFFVAPSVSEGSLGAYAPREDRVGAVTSSLSFCRPEASAEGVPRRLRASGGQGGGCHLEPFFLSPRGVSRGGSLGAYAPREDRVGAVTSSLSFCRPEASAEGGSLGACVPRENRVGNVAPSALFCRPERSEGSLGAYAPREDKKGSAPREDIPGRCPERSEGCHGLRSAGRSRELF